MVCAVNQRRRTLIFMNIIISCIASSMLMTALTSALPAVMGDLGIPLTSGQWLTSGYTLVAGVITPLTAFLITRFPTKKLYLVGLGITIIGIFLCAIAPSFQIMMFARGLQACGNGINMSIGQVVLLTIYPPEKRGTIMGWYGLTLGAAPSIAPLLAGILVDTLGWRSIFWFSLVIMAASFVWAVVTFADVLEIEKKQFDTASFVFSVVAFGALTMGIGNISSLGIASLHVWPVLLVGVIAGAIFVRKQLRSDKPFLDLGVFKDRNFTLSVIGSALIYFVMMGITMLLPVYIQSICKYSATVSGLVKMPGALMMAVTSLFAGKIYDKFGIKKLFVVGSIAMLISNIALAVISVSTSIWIVTAINLIYNIAIGCLMMPLVTWGMRKLGGTLTAHGSALMNTIRSVVGAMGTAVFVGIMTSVASLSGPKYGANAQVHGFNIAGVSMVFFTLALVIVALFFVKSEPRATEKSEET